MAKKLTASQIKTLNAIHLACKNSTHCDWYRLVKHGGSAQSIKTLETLGLVSVERKNFVYYTLTELGKEQVAKTNG